MEISKEYLKDLKVLHSTALDMGVDVSFYDTVSSIIESYDKAADEFMLDAKCGHSMSDSWAYHFGVKPMGLEGFESILEDKQSEVELTFDEVNTRISVLSGAISAMTAVVGHTGDSGAIDKLKQEIIRLAI